MYGTDPPRGTGEIADEPPRSGHISVLLVEDSPAQARLITAYLEDAGVEFAIRHATTMAEAERAIAAPIQPRSVDVVILDLGLPDAAGLEAVQRIRARDPGLPIVVVTGVADDVLALQALAAGAEDYLKRLPVEMLKIDMSFVRGIGKDAGDDAIVRAVASLATDMGILVVAEGVEHRQQLGRLVHLGCRFAQGYYFARPLTAAVARRWIKARPLVAREARSGTPTLRASA